MASRYYQRAMTKAQRNGALAKIHLAKKQLDMADDSYRAMLQAVAGVASSKDLTEQGINRVLAHLQKLGAVFVTPKRAGKPPHNLNSQADKAQQLEKIGALLADMQLPWEYAAAIAKQMYQKDALAFCSPRELIGITTALVKKQQKQEAAHV